MFRYLPRPPPLQCLRHERRCFQRHFRWQGRAHMSEGRGPPPRPSLGERIVKFRNFIAIVAGGYFFALSVAAYVDEKAPVWAQVMDTICRIVPPKTVSSNICNPTHRDTPIHQPIVHSDEFRVLILEPGSGTEEIRCHLRNVRISWRTRYHALSYVWGDETVRETILLGGHRTSVTSNLHSALMHLRDPTHARMLWVDAICINQDDLNERQEQVKKMNLIYSAARKVIIWLGPETPETQKSFSMIEKTSRRDYYLSPEWSADPILKLLRNSWFQRTWIIQEAVLAREPVLALGFQRLPWQEFERSCKIQLNSAIRNDPELDQALRAVSMIAHGRHECHTRFVGRDWKKRRIYTPDFRLVSTLSETRGFQCKDKRDKVFGILKLVTDVGPEDGHLGPNYEATVEKVYETVARWDITKNESLDILSCCSRKKNSNLSLPSWVPDFADMDEANPVLFLLDTKPQKGPNDGFRNGNSPVLFQVSEKPALGLSGRVVDTITRVAITPTPTDTVTSRHDAEGTAMAEAIRLKRQKWFEECVRIASNPYAVLTPKKDQEESAGLWVFGALEGFLNTLSPPKSLPHKNFWESQTLGMSSDQFNRFLSIMKPPSIHPWGIKTDALLKYAVILHQEPSSAAYDPDNLRWQAIECRQDEILRKFAYRRFCATQSGNLGWVPASAAEGDVVCLLSGARVPIILRRVEGKVTGHYRVIGDAYMDGLMLEKKDSVYVGGKRLTLV